MAEGSGSVGMTGDRWRPFVAVLPLMVGGCVDTSAGTVPVSGDVSAAPVTTQVSHSVLTSSFEARYVALRFSVAQGVQRLEVPKRPVRVTPTTVALAPTTTFVYDMVTTTVSVLTSVETPQEMVLRIFPEEDHRWALRVMACESSNDPLAVNSWSKTMGLFQHHPRYWDERAVLAGVAGADAFDPESNVVVAEWLLNVGGEGHVKGRQHWECK
jgi:hypothetical protein